MGRSVRRVPKDWQHPRDESGYYIPLLGGTFQEALRHWEEDEKDFQANPEWQGKYSSEQWHGKKPREEWYMPDFPTDQMTHWQMYETTSEGTPISPVCATPEELATWLANNEASAFAEHTATYKDWLAAIYEGQVPSACLSVRGDSMSLISGVEALPKLIQK